MISVEKATEIILNHTGNFGIESIPFNAANGRVLKEELVADRDFPPFNRVTMDGIAINYSRFLSGQREFQIQSLQAAGSVQQTLTNIEYCIEVMTGAVLPENTDAVIRYEDLDINDNIATITIENINHQQNIHQQGTDRTLNQAIVIPPKIISSAEIGIAATIGKTQVAVAKLPSVVIVSTGDELVSVEERPLPHQIRTSNVHTIISALDGWKLQADLLHLPDNEEATVKGLENCIQHYDVIILSGGVSKGKLDFVPNALEKLGVKKLFHRIQQRPGKPFWFGHKVDEATIFALPGNPVSSFMCINRYFIPWLRKSLDLEPFEQVYAQLAENIIFKPDLTYFAQVKLSHSEAGILKAMPVEGHGSGDLANLTDADAFIELPKGKDLYPQGEVYQIFKYR